MYHRHHAWILGAAFPAGPNPGDLVATYIYQDACRGSRQGRRHARVKCGRASVTCLNANNMIGWLNYRSDPEPSNPGKTRSARNRR